jgi:hypothetical protein|tara:strand:- start:437 stop:1522 length:1086 start_codon:yes stop_codon:yes gene_type:complete
MTELDIFSIDAKIRKNFEEEFSKLKKYEDKLSELDYIIENSYFNEHTKKKIISSRNDLHSNIEDIKIQKSYNFYLTEVLLFIEEYKTILKTPVKLNFMGKSSGNSKQKKELIKKFIEVAIKYVDIELQQHDHNPNIVCSNCGNKKEFDIIDNVLYICCRCYARQPVLKHNSSYNDIDRVNISSKYMYDPKIHFRDCIKQYQGKQNCSISEDVYIKLEEQFKLHYLLEGDEKTPRKERFKNITKNQIIIFLKELDNPKHYENVHLIHYNLTSIKPNDISHLEEKLLDDFDRLIELYHRKFKNIKRKNFINTQYVLYQLLQHHKHPCEKEDFIILKTVDRKFFHDEVTRELFTSLGWNHSPYF